MSRTTAKLFMHGRSQAVRLPKQFRLPGVEVRVSRIGNRVILEPMIAPSDSVRSIFADIDRILDGEILSDIPADAPVKPDKRRFFET